MRCLIPIFDRGCAACGWRALDLFEPVTLDPPPCPSCGTPTERVWLTRAAAVIGDATDCLQENGFRHPRHFTSKIERKRALKEAGVTEYVRHVTPPGTDKSPHTSNWGSRMDAKTLENARILVSRASSIKSDPIPAPPQMRIGLVHGELNQRGDVVWQHRRMLR